MLKHRRRVGYEKIGEREERDETEREEREREERQGSRVKRGHPIDEESTVGAQHRQLPLSL